MTHINELYELDRYELLNVFQKHFDVEISDNFTRNADLSIGTWNTADGYEVYVINNGDYASDLNFEYDVYYYQPSCAEIISRIIEVVNVHDAKVYCDDIDMYFDDEQAIIDSLVENFPNKFTDEDED